MYNNDQSKEEKKIIDAITSCCQQYIYCLHHNEQFEVLKNIRIRIRELEFSLRQLRKEKLQSDAFEVGNTGG